MGPTITAIERNLSVSQLRFLSARLTTKTDDEAAKICGIHPRNAANWKLEDPAFVEAYNSIWTDGLLLAKDYARKLLGKSVRVYDDALDAVRVSPTGETVPDHKSRLAAAEMIGKIHGLFVNRSEISGPGGKPIETKQAPMDLSVLSDEELRAYERIAAKLEGKE